LEEPLRQSKLWDSGQGHFVDRLPGLADELVRLKVDVIYANSATIAGFAKKATQTVPIVFLSSAEPVPAGLVNSLARPGGNVTGFTTIVAVLAGNDWSCSRMPFRSSLALQSFGSRKTKGLKNLGKKAKLRRKHSPSKFFLWR
jgi:ABC transporter substrate binding protein